MECGWVGEWGGGERGEVRGRLQRLQEGGRLAGVGVGGGEQMSL